MNLRKRGLGSFRDDSYWSLSENFSVNAWDQNFFDGSQYSHDHDYYDDNSVRAVRAF